MFKATEKTTMSRVRKAALVAGSAAALAVGFAGSASAQILQPLNAQASAFQSKYQPFFDYTQNSCYPATAVDANGHANGGLETTGTTAGGCHTDHLGQANTYVRTACDANWCAYMYALYFEKDQGTGGLTGHRHDWEKAVVWQKRGAETPSYVSVSQHSGFQTKAFSRTNHDGNHVRVVYHLDGATTHDFVFANAGQVPQAWGNHQWDAPDLIAMDKMKTKYPKAFNKLWTFDWSGDDAGQGATGANFPLQDFQGHFSSGLNTARNSVNKAFPNAIPSFRPNLAL
ncbi:NPP1 family protein [Streptomyces sp. NPDC054884]|uniref:NPP1 family protein n=1 Tax=Streptomyces sp. ME08-AFT2 TaxID=3028683 RepID=UPI0029B9C592|nr:NPP1 family protein [Streptomyces sp. ME08-AFT2]MDX3309170.1 NPP1 family protein [Streptomyces sp. ME08-AFT2]